MSAQNRAVELAEAAMREAIIARASAAIESGSAEAIAQARAEVERWNAASLRLVMAADDEVTAAMMSGDPDRHEKACQRYSKAIRTFNQPDFEHRCYTRVKFSREDRAGVRELFAGKLK